MTTSQDVLDAVKTALLGPQSGDDPAVYATGAGERVFRPGDWPTQSDQFPILKLRVVREQKQSLGRGGINYNVTASVRIQAEVSAPVQVDDLGASAAEQQLWALKHQVECAVINSYPLFGIVQELGSVDAQLAFNSDGGTHLAGVQIDMTFIFYQSAEDFFPLEAPALEEIHVSDPGHPGAGFISTLPE